MLDRVTLDAMPHHNVELPIACVEGWSTTQTWTGIRLADRATATGHPEPPAAIVSSLERFGAFNHAILQTNQILNPDALHRLMDRHTSWMWSTGAGSAVGRGVELALGGLEQLAART